MAYSLQYGNCRYDKVKIKNHRRGWLFVVAIFISIVLLQMVYPTQLNRFRQAALPFLEPEVQRSFSDMAKNMREGSAPADAIKVFCEEVFREGSN